MTTGVGNRLISPYSTHVQYNTWFAIDFHVGRDRGGSLVLARACRSCLQYEMLHMKLLGKSGITPGSVRGSSAADAPLQKEFNCPV